MTPRSLLLFLAGSLLSTAAVSSPLCAQNFAGGSHGVNGASMTPSASLTPWHETKPDKLLILQVRDGSLTVDGLTAKVQMNYDIKEQGYLYFFMPGEGTAVVSLVSMSDSQLVKNGIQGSRLEFNAGGHDFRLDSTVPLVANSTKEHKGGKDAKLDVYVRFDRSATGLGRTPMFGYGLTTRAPYNWPLSMRPEKTTMASTSAVEAPPLPRSVLPRMMTTTVAQASTLR